MILLQLVTGALLVTVIYSIMPASQPFYRLLVTVAAAILYSLLSQLTFSRTKGQITLSLYVIPLFIFLSGIGAASWYALSQQPANDHTLLKQRELLLTEGMIKDALYTISLRSLQKYYKGEEKNFTAEPYDTLTRYSLINKRFETPYNGTGIHIYLIESGADSLILAGVSNKITGSNPNFQNEGGGLGYIQHRAKVTQNGISVWREN